MKPWTSLVAVGVLLVFAITPELPTWKVCGVARHFGLHCPACGTTRSVWHFMHGRFLDSWAANPLGLIVCFLLIRMPLIEVTPNWRPVRFLNSPQADSVIQLATVAAIIFQLGFR